MTVQSQPRRRESVLRTVFRFAATPLYSALDVTIEGGQRVGLVGRSGSGKTTFVKLIQRLMVGRTAIIIAHRLSTVRAPDRILVFDKGQVVEDGPHEALLARRGPYRRLFDRQAGAGATESVAG